MAAHRSSNLATVLLFGLGVEQATPFERSVIDRRGLTVNSVDQVAADPEAAALAAREMMAERCDRLFVHFDVDVIDFTDTPLSENCGRNEGLAYEHAMHALRILLATPSLAALTITELNPDHADQDGESVKRFANSIAASLPPHRRFERPSGWLPAVPDAYVTRHRRAADSTDGMAPFPGPFQSGRRDSNSGPLDPQSSALTRLRHAPCRLEP